LEIENARLHLHPAAALAPKRLIRAAAVFQFSIFNFQFPLTPNCQPQNTQTMNAMNTTTPMKNISA
jgi:hypothetical protein